MSLVGLARNKLRSGLTALGVTVGVFALTTIIAVGQGLERSIVLLTDSESRSQLIVGSGFGPAASRDWASRSWRPSPATTTSNYYWVESVFHYPWWLIGLALTFAVVSASWQPWGPPTAPAASTR